uniref:MAK10-like protein n=1 Tax=Tanacetum cinerariifolium TaxID=118510 RepID=A0A6L2NB13_TANCI|nr:MAK10-like protein [Tanacetum cinerariifolium]
MSSITAQQAKLDLKLFPSRKDLRLGNATRDSILERYKEKPHFKFKMDKRKRFKLTMEIFRDIMKIYPRGLHLLRRHESSRSLHLLNSLLFQFHLKNLATKKSKRVKRSAKKSTKDPARGVVIIETLEMPLSKKKEKVNVARGKGIEMPSEVALAEEAQYEEGNDEDDSNNEQDSRSKGSDEENDSDDDNTQSDSEKGSDSEHETYKNESDSEYDQEENEEEIDDEEEEEDEFVRTPSNDSDDETKISDKAEGGKDEKMNYTTSQLYDDVDIRLNEPVDPDEGFVQKEGTNDEMINIFPIQMHKLFLQWMFTSIMKYQARKLPHSLLYLSQLSPILHQNTPPLFHDQYHPLLLHHHIQHPHRHQQLKQQILHLHFLISHQSSNSTTKVVELKKNDPFETQVTALVDEHLDARLGATRDEFIDFLSASITARITEQVKNTLPQILPKEVSNSPLVIQRMITESLEHAIQAKESSQPLYSYEAVDSLTEFELKKILIEKMDKSESYLAALEHRRDQRKSFYGYARGLESRHDVYSTKRILAVTRVEITRNNSLLGDDVSDFAIALRLFTRSIVIQKRVEDLQLAVESYQKKIHVAKQETTKPDIRKKDPYTPYQDPQRFIYVDTLGRNRLMHSDELYKFSKGTLTRLRTSLEDITKNIHMKYLPKRRWSTLEKKRDNIIIKAIDKQLKERRMMTLSYCVRHHKIDTKVIHNDDENPSRASIKQALGRGFYLCDHVPGALGWLLEEIHMTWAHLKKKRTRLQLYTKSLKKLCIQSVETALRVSSDSEITPDLATRATATPLSFPKEPRFPLRSDTIRLVQNGCAFHEGPIQHLKNFLRIVDPIDLNGAIRNTTHLRLFCFSLRGQAINWLDRLPAGSISTSDDLLSRFLAQFFSPRRTAKL